MSETSITKLIEPLLLDPTITEILIDGPDSVYVEKEGQLCDIPSPFKDASEIYALIDALSQPLGVRVDDQHPMVSLRLPDNSVVNITIPPIAITGPSITYLKVRPMPLTMPDLLRYGCLSADMADFIQACINARMNIVLSGGTASGKTTLLSILCHMVPRDERMVIVQKDDFVSIERKRLVRLETRPPNIEGKGEITMRDLVLNALHMRPDRIVVSNVSGGEAYDLAEAMNNGYDGVLLSIHAQNARDALDSLETMASMGKPSYPLLALRHRLAMIDLVLQQERLRDGSRKIVSISEVTGLENNNLKMTDIFRFEQTGFEDGKIIGAHRPSGYIPLIMDVLKDMGVKLEMFQSR